VGGGGEINSEREGKINSGRINQSRIQGIEKSNHLLPDQSKEGTMNYGRNNQLKKQG